MFLFIREMIEPTFQTPPAKYGRYINSCTQKICLILSSFAISDLFQSQRCTLTWRIQTECWILISK